MIFHPMLGMVAWDECYPLQCVMTPVPKAQLQYLRVLKSLARPENDPGTPHTLSHRPNHLAMEPTDFKYRFCSITSVIISYL